MPAARKLTLSHVGDLRCRGNELARLKHPNIVGVYDYGVDARGPYYYTMELLSGHDLRELSPLPYADVCLHLRDLASA